VQATDVAQSASAYEAKEMCKEQLEKLGDDIRELGYLKKRAATKIVMLEQNVTYAASEKNLRRMARDKLEDVKNGLELQICEAQAIVSLGHGPMIEVFDQLGKTYAVSDEALNALLSRYQQGRCLSRFGAHSLCGVEPPESTKDNAR
jgi:hypothetical protein